MADLPRFMQTSEFEVTPVQNRADVAAGIGQLAEGINRMSGERLAQEKQLFLEANKYQTGADISGS